MSSTADTKVILFRSHRGGLEESMATATEVESLSDVRALLPELPSEAEIKCAYYGYDWRIAWNTYVITVNGDAVGFTNGHLT